MKGRNLKALVVAAGVVSMLGSGYALAEHHEGEGSREVKCYGINSCGGKGECGAPDGSHDCAGKNSCEGKGWVKTTADECEEKGGEILGEE